MKRVNRKVVIGSALMVACASGLSACTGTASVLGYGPDFELRGNAEGIDAFYQGVIAEIESAKSADGKATEASSLYRAKEETRRLRYLKPAKN